MPVKLRVVRALLDLTQAECASHLALSPRTYSGWETGARPIPYRTWQWLDDRLRELVAEAELGERLRRQTFTEDYGRMVPLPAE